MTAPDTACVVTSIGEAVFEWDAATNAMHWVGATAALFREADADVLGDARAFARLIDPAGQARREAMILNSIMADEGAGVPYQVEYALASGEAEVWIEETGRWFAGADGRPARAHGMVRAVTARHAHEECLARLARCDSLTGGLNRSYLVEALNEMLEGAAKFRKPFGFLVVAVDHLARLNDAFGFEVADEVINELARRIRMRLRGGDILGRLSGNKLGLILRDCTMEDMKIAAERFLVTIRDQPVSTSSGAVVVTASIGGVVAPRHGRSAVDIISRAQEALDMAKRRRRGSFRCWLPNVERDARRRTNIRITDEIVTALNDRRIMLAFEPVADIVTRQPAFHECLVRMRGVGGEVRLANDVVPVAEKLGLIRLVDHRVLELVVAELAANPAIRLSLNISPDTTADPDWWGGLDGLLRAHPGVAERLIVEITETTAIQDIDDVRGFVTRLKNLGSRIAIDDFGAGYTSFRNLRRLGVDIVKIDGAFVQNIVSSADDRAFVQTLIDLARRLGLETVAEWVQDEAATALLKEWGCHYIQGHAIGLAALEAPWHEGAEAARLGCAG
ncbi:MAG: bifunctional diguanylate cyclase/phosphodiesterase [Xanthobacteraceae bacterium]|nr:MAG: bifunctional diguanylate cyclase/phosphodiesterase [Xanthobacteraceae bacterium]